MECTGNSPKELIDFAEEKERKKSCRERGEIIFKVKAFCEWLIKEHPQ
jgi:hypothetical protein